MFFPTRLLCLTLLAWFAVTSAMAQDIRIKKNPAPEWWGDQEIVYDQWWTHGALRDDKEASILGSAYKTEAEAVAAAKKWLASNRAVNKPSDWTYLKFVEIEADPTPKGKRTGKQEENPAREKDNVKDKAEKGLTLDPDLKFDSPEDKLFTDAMWRVGKTLTQDAADALKKRNREVQDEFRRAKEALGFVRNDVKNQAEINYRKANDLVKQYNSTLKGYSSSGPGFQVFGKVSPLGGFSEEEIRQAVARAEEEAARNKPVSLAGTKWKSGSYWLEFKDDTSARVNHYGQDYTGEYSVSDGVVTFDLAAKPDGIGNVYRVKARLNIKADKLKGYFAWRTYLPEWSESDGSEFEKR